jgi:hypothetical protein
MVAVVHSFEWKYFIKTTPCSTYPVHHPVTLVPYTATTFKQNTFLLFESVKNQGLNLISGIRPQGFVSNSDKNSARPFA